jgi:hypothetical protein
LRDPVERVYSQYKTWHRSGLVRGPFDYDAQCRRLGANGSYASNVKAWREACGVENVLVQIYEDLESNQQAYLDTFCAFVGTSPIDLEKIKLSHRKVNPSQQSPRSLLLARIWRTPSYLVNAPSGAPLGSSS